VPGQERSLTPHAAARWASDRRSVNLD
jgi:hypothetical protein